MTRLFFYYIWHTFVNSIKKLFKTWVAILIAVCFVLGIAFGIGFGFLMNYIDEATGESESIEEIDESYEEAEDLTADDTIPESAVDCIATAAIGLLLILGLWNADKSGSSIFTMPDVNTLFPSPNPPQSVLMYKTVMQAGIVFFSSFYLLAQIPNLINLGLKPLTIISIFIALILTVITMKFLTVLGYEIAASRTNGKKNLRRIVYATVFVITDVYVLYAKFTGLSILKAALRLTTGKYTRLIPFIGWLKGIILFTYEGNWLFAVLSLLASVITVVIIAYIIWHIKVDFYEDALSFAQEQQEKIIAISENRKANSKKHRIKIKRENSLFGSGAQMILTKSLTARFRFATLKIFTKTAITYLICSILICIFTTRLSDSATLTPIGVVLTLLIFLRAFGDPAFTDRNDPIFLMMPQTAFKRTFYLNITGTVECAMDILPALVIAEIMVRKSLLLLLFWYLLLVSLDFLISSTRTLFYFLLPPKIHPAIKTVFILSFTVVALMISITAIAIGSGTHHMIAALFTAAAVNLAAGLTASFLGSLFLDSGIA